MAHHITDEQGPEATGAHPQASAPPEEVDIVVVGAGLAGLTAAATAARAGRRVHVVDSRSSGGRARSDHRDGFVLNQGAHALYRGGAGRAVLGRLGLRPTGGKPLTRHGRVQRGGRPAPIPETPWRLARCGVLPARSKVQVARLLGTLPLTDPAGAAGLSVTGWLDGHALDDAARALVEATTRIATYCGDLDVLAADVAIGQLKLALAKGVDYLDGGWETLVSGLADVATGAGATIGAGDPSQSIDDAGGGRWVVTTRHGAVRAPAVVVAPGSPAAARALLPVDPAWRTLGPPAEVACLDLGLARRPDPVVLFDLDSPRYLSTHCPPARLAPAGNVVVHLLRYGVRTSDEDRSDLWALAGSAGIGEADAVTQRFLHRMVAMSTVPVPGEGLAGRPPVAVDGCPGLFVAGDWVGETGLLADASFASGEAAGLSAAAAAGVVPGPRSVAV